MLKQIKNFLYDISDIIITLIIIAVIVFSISMIMSSSIGVDFSTQFSDIEPEAQPQQTQEVAKPSQSNVVTESKPSLPNDNTNSTASNPENTTNKPATTQSTQTQPAAQTNTQQNQEIVIEFKPGSYPSELAQTMQEKGVITDANAFVNFLVEKELDTVLQPGTYTFKQGMTNEEISKVLFSE